jgi:hypothetical protein
LYTSIFVPESRYGKAYHDSKWGSWQQGLYTNKAYTVFTDIHKLSMTAQMAQEVAHYTVATGDTDFTELNAWWLETKLGKKKFLIPFDAGCCATALAPDATPSEVETMHLQLLIHQPWFKNILGDAVIDDAAAEKARQIEARATDGVLFSKIREELEGVGKGELQEAYRVLDKFAAGARCIVNANARSETWRKLLDTVFPV